MSGLESEPQNDRPAVKCHAKAATFFGFVIWRSKSSAGVTQQAWQLHRVVGKMLECGSGKMTRGGDHQRPININRFSLLSRERRFLREYTLGRQRHRDIPGRSVSEDSVRI